MEFQSCGNHHRIRFSFVVAPYWNCSSLVGINMEIQTPEAGTAKIPPNFPLQSQGRCQSWARLPLLRMDLPGKFLEKQS